MATNWPNSVQTFTNPTAGSALNSPSHADQHITVNDTVEALQQYAGLVKIATVNVSSVNTYNIDNIFSSQFTNYRLIINTTSGSYSYLYMRYRTSGGTQTTGYYEATEYKTFVGGNAILTVSNGSELRVGEVESRSGSVIDIFNPYAGEAVHTFNAILYGSSGKVTSYEGGGLQNSATSKTGIALLVSGGLTWSGKVIVYGYNQ